MVSSPSIYYVLESAPAAEALKLIGAVHVQIVQVPHLSIYLQFSMAEDRHNIWYVNQIDIPHSYKC